jgi:hypothetical protein
VRLRVQSQPSALNAETLGGKVDFLKPLAGA